MLIKGIISIIPIEAGGNILQFCFHGVNYTMHSSVISFIACFNNMLKIKKCNYVLTF